MPGLREQTKAKPQQTVGAQLEQDPCQQHRHRRGSLGVGIRQPGVKREQGDLDAESDQQRTHQHQLTGHAQLPGQHRTQAEIHGARHQRQAEKRRQDQHP